MGGQLYPERLVNLGFKPDGYYFLNSVKSGKVLEVKDASTADSAVVDQWSNNGGNHQK
ncbi:RICIN domain-containing protein [Paenibacillus prosopidis]|uniref:RICIN domain-containing protein n=1 Tax=Paenibacillus prosopidis TaxID=630520 RepID=UPI0015F1A9EC